MAQRGGARSEMAQRLREAAEASDAWPREAASLQAEAWYQLTEGTLRPLAWRHQLAEVPKLQALLGAISRACGLEPTPPGAVRAGSNPLLALHRGAIDELMPGPCKRLWSDPSEAGEDDVMSIMVATGRRPLAMHGDRESFGANYEAYGELVFQPLARSFSFAVPSDAALSCVARHSPLVEVGAGTGYWAALLEARGCNVLAYDMSPPDAEGAGASKQFYCTYTEVRQGGPRVLEDHPDRTLLLVWPFSEGTPRGARGGDWDAACLVHCECDTVIYAGDWAGRGLFPGPGQNSSLAFQRILQKDFECIERVALPNWPQVRDDLSVWRRRALHST